MVKDGAQSQHRHQGGPCVPPPPPAVTQFPQTDTHGACAGVRHDGFPRQVPRRSVPHKPGAQKGARCAFPPESGLRGPSVDPETRKRAPRCHGGREARSPAFLEPPGRLCKFPFGLSFSKGHSRSGDRIPSLQGSCQPTH